MLRFEGKAALVTGAASGIGRATALRLASEGARVACADVQREAVEEVAARVREAGGEAIACECDVTDPKAVRATVSDTVSAFGSLDVLCHIAGILHFANSHDVTLEQWNRVIGVNLTGTFLVCQAAMPHLLESKGAIVNMSSVAGQKAQPWALAYSASKGGVIALTRGLACEYGKQGVRVNSICPASIDTPIQKAFTLPDGADPKLLKRVMPFVAFAPAEDCAAAIAFLASADAAHVNGTELVVDGGMSM